MYTKRHKSRFHQLIVLLLIVTLAGVGFSARGRSEERSRGQQGSEQKAAAASQKSQAPARTESRSQASQQRQPQQRSQPTPARQSAPSRNTQPARVTRPAPSAPRTQPARSVERRATPQRQQTAPTVTRQTQPSRSVDRQTVRQTSSQPTPQRSKVVPARPVNRTVEIVSTAKMNNSRSNRTSVSVQAPAVSSAGKSGSKTSARSRTVIVPSASTKTNTSATKPTSRESVVKTVSPSKSIGTSRRTVSRTVSKIAPRSTISVTNRRSEESVNRISAEKPKTTFQVFGEASKERTKQTTSIAERTHTGSLGKREKTTRPIRITTNEIKTEPTRVIVNNTSTTTDSTRTFSGTHRERTRRSEPSSTIVINNDNRVIVQGSPTQYYPRPHFSRHLFHDIRYIREDPHWLHYGSGFYFRWSSSSCGIVVSLPYHRYHSYVHYSTPYYGLSYYYPRYHRKYIFVSVGGYWPYSYRYRRYYWYGCHPYYWYGANVIYEPAQHVTYYNTYNYYNTADTTGYGFSSSAQPYYTLGNPKGEVIDEPEFQTAADLCFDHAVELFAAANYEDAVEQFREAITLSPDDIILPFTYSQALFAAGDYAHAASVLRAAMGNIPEDELTIYYPRGLYEDEKVLTEQIDQLKIAADNEPFASDYQLLLGYQYLGFGDFEKAHLPLTLAANDPANEDAAGKLLELAAQLEAEQD